jgi:hypothetical protein
MRQQDIAAMLNQLAATHTARAGADAATALGEMIRRAWDDRMLARLEALIEDGGAELSDIAHKAARLALGREE